jgi:UDP-N-acetylglucosamine 1-carboxyvinyltransferase
MKKELAVIGKIIQTSREERGITQAEFAEKLNTTQSAVARIEAGEQNISTKLLRKMSSVLGKDIVEISKGAINIEVTGRQKLSGVVITKTSKNAAVALLCASILNKGKTILKNVPRIEEVYRIIEVLESIGVAVKWTKNDLELKPRGKFNLDRLNISSAVKTRSVIMLTAPLAHHLKRFSIPHPGGCRLGARTIGPHIFALEKFGLNIETRSKDYKVSRKKLKSNYIVLYESGDTVTENVLMASALMPGKTTVKFASANYQVQDLCFFLQKLGVKIDGIGTTTLTIVGKPDINTNVEYAISEDPIDSMFFITAAIVTKSSIVVKRAPIDFLELELEKLGRMGLRFKISKKYKALNGMTDLVDIKIMPSRLVALKDKIEARPFPGLNIDNLPFFAVIATQAKGQTLIHDWVYEERAVHYKELDKLGASTILADQHRLFVNGPTKLRANEIICPPALRPAAIVLIGMLSAEGTSVLRNIYSINRGYENIIKRLNDLGARIKVLSEF